MPVAAADPDPLPYPAAVDVRRRPTPTAPAPPPPTPREHDPPPPPHRHAQPPRQVLVRAGSTTRRSPGTGTGSTAGAARRLALELHEPPRRACRAPASPPRRPRGEPRERRRERAAAGPRGARRPRSARPPTGPSAHAPAGERDARVGVREALGLPPPPVLGERRRPSSSPRSVAPGGRRPSPSRASPHARPEQVRMPVLRQPGDELGRPDAAERPRAATAAARAKRDVEPGVRPEVDVQARPRCRAERSAGPHPEAVPVDLARAARSRSARGRPGWAASATIAHGPAASRQTPHSAITTRPAAASVIRQ